MLSYHGTSSASATAIAGAGVDVTLGGGELGRGFYTGQHLHEAKTWAFHVSNDKQANVVEFDADDDHVEALDILMMDHGTASLRRHMIRRRTQTRTYLFDVDLVWAPIVGSDRVTGDQYKWESSGAGEVLNGAHTTRRVL